jgi:hypothetical protein
VVAGSKPRSGNVPAKPPSPLLHCPKHSRVTSQPKVVAAPKVEEFAPTKQNAAAAHLLKWLGFNHGVSLSRSGPSNHAESVKRLEPLRCDQLDDVAIFERNVLPAQQLGRRNADGLPIAHDEDVAGFDGWHIPGLQHRFGQGQVLCPRD